MAFLEMKIFSESLGKGTSVFVAIPQRSTVGQIGLDGKKTTEKYKCLYLLHGLSDDASAWSRRSSIERYAEKYGIAVVMPNADKSFYTDMKHGDRYYEYIAHELPKISEDLLPISDRPEDRYIAGLSMGGYGALKIALREEGNFHAAAALSPVANIKTAREVFSTLKNVFGEDLNIPNEDDLFYLAENCHTRPEIYITIGTQDSLYDNCQSFVSKLNRENYKFVYKEHPGSHEWGFWDEHIKDILQWMFG